MRGELGARWSPVFSSATYLLEMYLSRTNSMAASMAFCSFGGIGDPCSAVEWASHDSSIIPLLSFQSDMSSWLKGKYGGSGASGSKGRPSSKKSGKKLK